MSDDQPSREKSTTYYVKIEIGQHVPQDTGFYATFSMKELVNGVENLKQAIANVFNNLQSYMDRRMTGDVWNKKR